MFPKMRRDETCNVEHLKDIAGFSSRIWQESPGWLQPRQEQVIP